LAGGASDSRSGRAGERAVTLFLCGDVMTGRGIDQVLPHPVEPVLYEPYVRSALDYVDLAQRRNGPIPRPVDWPYVWGDALSELARVAPDARIVNLETAITVSDEPWPGKGIHYRMHPDNVRCLIAAQLDCCVLANNHVMDWGRAGLVETLATLRSAGLRTAGAGESAAEAAAPAVLDLSGGGRVLVFGFCTEDSGVPARWAAGNDRPGVNLLPDLSSRSVDGIARGVAQWRRAGDIVVASIHWGGNWGYAIAAEQRAFARMLVERAGVDVVHGHSSHHPKGIEVHRGKALLYGCGDWFNDYEGIGGYEAYRGDLALMYFPSFDPATGELLRFSLTPTRTRRFRIERAAPDEAEWLRATLNREGRKLGTQVTSEEGGRLLLLAG
jgi:poly-gamma-glutamate synthesis protein (capsule biosynthesis protein)